MPGISRFFGIIIRMFLTSLILRISMWSIKVTRRCLI